MKKVIHRTPCRCVKCRAKLEQRVRDLRQSGQSLTIISDIVHVSVASVWRILKGEALPGEIHGRNGKTYRNMANMRGPGVRGNQRVSVQSVRGVVLS